MKQKVKDRYVMEFAQKKNQFVVEILLGCGRLLLQQTV